MSTWRRFSAVELFLDNANEEMDPVFPLPEWLTLKVWLRVLEYAQITNSDKDSDSCRRFLSQNTDSLGAVARAGEYLGFAELTEVASAALLLALRTEIKAQVQRGGLDVASISDAIMQTPGKEDLRLLFPPSELDSTWLDEVIPLAPELFWPLVDQLVLADVLPREGVIPGLVRTLIWPCVNVERLRPMQVSGIWGGGISEQYLELLLPGKQLHEFDPCALRCKIRSHDQGWGGEEGLRGTYHGSYTFGSLEVMGQQIGDRLYTNRTAVSEWQHHLKVFFKDSQVMEALKSASCSDREDSTDVSITLTLHAFYPGWTNHVSDASMDCFLLPKGYVWPRP